MSGRLDGGQVPSGAFHAQYGNRFTRHEARRGFDGRIPATVQNQRRILADHPRRISSERQILVPSSVLATIPGGFRVIPSVLHDDSIIGALLSLDGQANLRIRNYE